MNLDMEFMKNAQQVGITFTDVTTLEGATFIPSVSEEGVISWENDQGLPNPTAVNIKGEKGDNGKDGWSVDVAVTEIEAGTRVTFYRIPPDFGTAEPAGVIVLKDGTTPLKGVDYFTEAEKAEFVNDILVALPRWTGGDY